MRETGYIILLRFDLRATRKFREMEFPPDWEFLPAGEFGTAEARTTGDYGAEILAQIRPSGRVVDHYRVTLGGSKILKVNKALSAMLLLPKAATWSLQYEVFLKDVPIRRNMTTGAWMDVSKLIEEREALVMDKEELVPYETVVQVLQDADTKAAIRFAVVIREDKKLQLDLQCLPVSAAFLSGKPAFRG